LVVRRQESKRTVGGLLASLRVNGRKGPTNLSGSNIHAGNDVGEQVAEVFAELHTDLIKCAIFRHHDTVIAKPNLL
jgi:hypothetical protein